MTTPLENMGIDLNTKLWTAKVLADQPEMVKQVHKNYFKAGADCGITCSYQATVPGLMDIGYTKEQAEELIAKSVERRVVAGRRRKSRPYLAAVPGKCRPIWGISGRWLRISGAL